MPSRKKINFSIFLKLIILIIIFTVLVNLSIGFIVRLSFDNNPVRPPTKLSYVFNDYFIKDVGNPPDTLKAREVLTRLGTGVRFETSKSNWKSREAIPSINELKNESGFDENKKQFSMRTKEGFYEIYKVDDGYIIFVPPLMPREDLDLEQAIIPLIIMFTVLALLLYFSLLWIFKPIKKLSEAVEQISAGNFDVPIDIKRKDELGNLGDSINEMKINISNMIKAKESLLIDVSHELRSPLTRIKLANEFVDDGKIKDKIREDVIEMEMMVSGLLDTYRLETFSGRLKTENTDIIKLLKNIISKFNNTRIDLITDFETRELRIDKSKIEVALRNIIDNALKYSDRKPVKISILESPGNKEETLISVRDYGRGIESDEISKIYEPFYRIDKSRDKKTAGYGLGLSMVKKILDLHDSTIKIKSKPTEGTEFIITLRNK